MKSIMILNSLIEKLFKIGKSSFMDIEELYQKGIINTIFKDNDIDNIIKKDFINYLRCLLEYNYPYYYNKKVALEVMLYPTLNYGAYYLLSLYCGNKDAYRNLPLLLKSIIDKFELREFDSVDMNQLISSVYKYYDIDNNSSYVEPTIKFKGIYTDYSKYDDTYDSIQIDVTDQKKFFVWSEHKSFELENTNYKTWVARDCGDGYGFDILSFDEVENREKLIEVKSGKYDYFTLTKNEVNVMRKSHFNNADYYIHKYTYYSNTNEVLLRVLKYDYSLDVFYDTFGEMYSYCSCDEGYNVHKTTESEKKLILKDR